MSDHAGTEQQYVQALQATHRVMVEMQKQMHMLQFRLDHLERQLGAAGAPVAIPLTAATLSPTGPMSAHSYYYWQQQQQQQQQQHHQQAAAVAAAAAAGLGGGAGAGPWMDGTSATASTDIHHANTQLEEELQRLGVGPHAYAASAQQKQYRDEAIMAMLSGSPTSRTPTNVAPMGGFPVPGPELHTLQPFPSPVHGGGGGGAMPSPVLANAAGGYANVFPAVGNGFDPMNMAAGPNAGAGGPTAITIDPARSNNEALDRACMHPYLKELCVKGCKSITNYTPLMRLRNLWKLNLQGCSLHVDDYVVKIIGAHNKRLSRLNLCGCERITDASALSQLTFLFDLNLSGTQITTASLEAISLGCSQLSRLAINSCPQITSVSSVRHLRELKLLYCRYSGNISPASIGEMLAAIGRNLLTLNVDGIKFPRLDLTHLPLGSALKNLNLKDNTEVVSLRWLTDIPDAAAMMGSLEMLDVEGCAGLVDLGTITNLPALKTLRLSHTAVTTQELAKVAASGSITSIYMDGCAHVTSVECLAGMRSLTKLVLDPQMQHGNPAEKGLSALHQHFGARLEIAFALHNNNNNNNNNSGSAVGSPTGHGHGHGSAHLLAVHPSPFTTPTAHVVPPLPASIGLGVIGDPVKKDTHI